MVLKLVVPLLVSSYSIVRYRAGETMRKYALQFPNSIELIVPLLMAHLQMTDHFENQVESLYFLIKQAGDHKIMFMAYNLNVIAQTWPALVLLKSFENRTIDALISILEKCLKAFDFITFSIENVNIIGKIGDMLEGAKKLNFKVSPEEIETNQKLLSLKNEENLKLWKNIVDGMIHLLRSEKL